MAARRAFLSRAYRPGKKIKPSTFLILIASPAFERFQGRPLALRLAIPGRAGALLRPAVAEVPQCEFENFGPQNPFSHHHDRHKSLNDRPFSAASAEQPSVFNRVDDVDLLRHKQKSL
jgi:hypothetical protein